MSQEKSRALAHKHLKYIQKKIPNLQHGRAYDIALRAAEKKGGKKFIDGELKLIRPKSVQFS